MSIGNARDLSLFSLSPRRTSLANANVRHLLHRLQELPVHCLFDISFTQEPRAARPLAESDMIGVTITPATSAPTSFPRHPKTDQVPRSSSREGILSESELVRQLAKGPPREIAGDGYGRESEIRHSRRTCENPNRMGRLAGWPVLGLAGPVVASVSPRNPDGGVREWMPLSADQVNEIVRELSKWAGGLSALLCS
jgi:hypothetical protein